MTQRYDITKTYQWNYDHAPEPVAELHRPINGSWSLCGRAVASPLGIAAGPLLNSRWILYYASLGFDILTYKTVRRCVHSCYPLPNLLPVCPTSMTGDEREVHDRREMEDSWAISFGMPSQDPRVWREDVGVARDRLSADKLLAVSVVATVEPGWSMQRIADDYATCARWAADAGADLVEINLSCPNVTTCDGQLYQHPKDAGLVAQAVKQAIGHTPLLAKVGHVPDDEAAFQLLTHLAPSVDALVMVNGLASRIVGVDGESRFGGQMRGIGGGAIREVSRKQVSRFRSLIERHDFEIEIVGCGGISSADDVRAMITRGATAVQLATAAMLNPAIAIDIRRDLSSDETFGGS